MIRGFVSDDGVPTITLSVSGQNYTAVIDTGFNGDLELPVDLEDSLNPLFVGRVTSALAGGQTIDEDVYLVDFPFDNRMVQTEATFVKGSQILIGTHLLQDYHLQIDFAGKTVQLARVRNNSS